MSVITLKKPVEINGEEVKEITYDLEGLTGNDVALAIKDLAKNNLIVTMAETDQNYHAALFAVSAGLSYADVKLLGLKDYIKVCNIVRDFFLEE